MECCLGHFWWKIFSSKFRLLFWIMFLLNFVEIFMLFWSKLDGYVRLQHGIADKTYENHWIFWWNHAKNMVQIGVENLMKIFSIRNAPNNIPWSLKVFPVMSVTIFPRKTIKNSCFLMFVGYCRDSNSKCMHYSIALQKRILFGRVRSGK